MKKLSIFAGLLIFTLVSCKSSTSTSSSTDNTTEETVVTPTKTSPKNPSVLKGRNLATE